MPYKESKCFKASLDHHLFLSEPIEPIGPERIDVVKFIKAFKVPFVPIVSTIISEDSLVKQSWKRRFILKS